MLVQVAAGLGAGAAAFIAGYNTMSPTAQLYGRTFIGERGTKRLALTYDDGPNDPHTLRLLEVLAKHNVKATFFLIGKYVKLRPDIALAVSDAGHVVANHTFSHPNLIFCSAGETKRQIADCERVVSDATGSCARLFRPPFGGRRPASLRAVRAMGYAPIMWSVTSYDWKATAAAQVVEKVVKQVKGGEVILLHDGGHKRFGVDRSPTVQATDELVRRYLGEGYELVTIPEMMGQASGFRFQASGNPTP